MHILSLSVSPVTVFMYVCMSLCISVCHCSFIVHYVPPNRKEKLIVVEVYLFKFLSFNIDGTFIPPPVTQIFLPKILLIKISSNPG